jgi:hypothetical protein
MSMEKNKLVLDPSSTLFFLQAYLFFFFLFTIGYDKLEIQINLFMFEEEIS